MCTACGRLRRDCRLHPYQRISGAPARVLVLLPSCLMS
ncbi:MAG: hypothetical protein IJH22_04795 [Firmicutes bacterium]|nr:hypothetical protein [Bacillota bacterium]